MSLGDLVGVDGRQSGQLQDRPDRERGVRAEVVANPPLGHRPAGLQPDDAVGVRTAVEVDMDRHRRHQRRPVDVGRCRRIEGLLGQVGAAQQQDRGDPATFEGVGIALLGQQPGQTVQRGVEGLDHMDGSTDVEALHPVLHRTGRQRHLPLGLAFALSGGLGVRGRHRALDQGLEPAVGQAAVGVRRDPGVDVGRLLRGQIAGPARHQASQVDAGLARPYPRPQAGEPVSQVEPVGHQQPHRDRRHPQPGPSSAAANSVTSGVPRPPIRRTRSRPGLPAWAAPSVWESWR